MADVKVEVGDRVKVRRWFLGAKYEAEGTVTDILATLGRTLIKVNGRWWFAVNDGYQNACEKIEG